MREKGQQSAKFLTHLVTYRGEKKKKNVCFYCTQVGVRAKQTFVCFFFFFSMNLSLRQHFLQPPFSSSSGLSLIPMWTKSINNPCHNFHSCEHCYHSHRCSQLVFMEFVCGMVMKAVIIIKIMIIFITVMTQGSSRKHCSEVYRGPRAFSEPESRALRDFIMARSTLLSSAPWCSSSSRGRTSRCNSSSYASSSQSSSKAP